MEDTGQAGPAENLPEPEPLSPSVEAEAEDEADDGDEFSFPVPPVAADSCIVPVYPIFGRPPSLPPRGEVVVVEEEPGTATVRVPLGRLLLEEREFRAREHDGRSASARRAWREEDDDASGGGGGAGDEDLEGVPPESYCLWAPGGGGQSSAPASPRRCRKSGSTGSVLRWRRISDRLVGRSHSDGKEKFVFLTAAVPEPPRRSIKEEEEGGGGINKGGGDAGSVAHQLRYYSRGGGGSGSGSRRRSYLPYKQELVGLFANVSGLRRSYHPF
ncbi:uncharacterized protein [Miscanthus floridulus]|uniref:uncharacterized protein n=1 Tax=Miscanthus floridulus TaxID=154761 RepID=UPI0034590449